MSLHQVKVATKEVLEIVKENKKKHDAIFKDAVEGFWLEAEKALKKTEKEQISTWEKAHKEQLKRMRKQLRDNKKNLKEQIKKELVFVEQKKKDALFIYMKNKYPESHADDYIGTIRRLELCTEDKVELDTQEFDRYVRNKWEWRDSFLASNTGYVTSYYNSPISGGFVGCGTTYPNFPLAISASYSCNSVSAYWGTGSCFGTSSWSLGNNALDNF